MPDAIARPRSKFRISADGAVQDAGLEFLMLPVRRHARLMTRDGFHQQFVLVRQPGDARPPHVHEYDARVHVLRGELTIERADTVTLCEGQSLVVAAGERHAEMTGSDGAILLVGCR